MKVLLTLKPHQPLPKVAFKHIKGKEFVVTLASQDELVYLRNSYTLSRHPETPQAWSDDILKPDTHFNPPGKAVIRNASGKVIALQG